MPGYELIDEEEKQSVLKVFDNGGVFFRHGFDSIRKNQYKVKEFESAFAKKFGFIYAQAVSSGTAALKVGLKALGIGPGDEVITQCHTFVATVEAIVECNAEPVITEINDTLNMDPSNLDSKITERTKAIIPVHMLGVSAQMDEIMRVANKHNIPVLEDTAQALGASYRGKYLGTIGEVGTYSFDHGKVLTTGEGGMVGTNNESIYLRSRAYHDHGHEYNPLVPRGEDTRSSSGFNFRMMELQGAIGLVQLRKLEYALNMQRANKKIIKEQLRDLSIRFRDIPDENGDAGDCLVLFLETEERAKKVAQRLLKEGIGTKNLPSALNWHFSGTWDHIFRNIPSYKDKQITKLWSKSAAILRSAIAIPIMIKMDEQQISSLVSKIKVSLND